jgi:hypothetical protein
VLKTVPDDVRQQLRDMVVDRPEGPVSGGQFTITTTPGGVELSFGEDSIEQVTEDYLYDKDGNPRHEEDDASDWENFVTLDTASSFFTSTELENSIEYLYPDEPWF